jgi:2',3'-cyclic-nucleotide 2'-phosphodiesterase (5'-nucleotidase family)
MESLLLIINNELNISLIETDLVTYQLYNLLMALTFLLTLLSLALTLHSRFETVAIISTNDIHGRAFPTKILRTDTNETYKYGGLVYMASMIERLRKEYKGNVLYLDAVDGGTS